MKVLQTVFLAFLFSILVPTVSHAGEPPIAAMETPRPIQVPAGTTIDAVKRGIRKALYLKDWGIVEAGPNQLNGLFNKGNKYTIEIALTYSPQSVEFKYKNSSGLNYDGSLIHRTYNDRLADLEKAIRAELDAF